MDSIVLIRFVSLAVVRVCLQWRAIKCVVITTVS
jgi:hypothetical protein